MAPDRAQLAGVRQHLRVAPHGHDPQQVGAAEASGAAGHRDRWDDAGAADQAQRRGRGVPGEPATDRPAHLEHVADLRDVGQELRDLTVRQPLDEELDQGVVVVRGERVGALGGVVVRRAEPDQVVLAGPVPLPVVDVHPQPDRVGVGSSFSMIARSSRR